MESILVILSDHPEEIARKIGEKTSVGDYRLVGEKTKLLSDTYFDTPNRFLSHHKLNLRIRAENENRWITMKTHPRRTLWGGMVRAEMEVPWSLETLEKMVSELKIPTQPPDPGIRSNPSDPVELLKNKGLIPIQHRETHREVRNVTAGTEGSHVLAELDVDSVLYDFDNQKIRLFEVEVESKSEKGQDVVKSVTKSLKGEYGSILRSWRHGKLATGTAIAKLLKSGELRPLIDAEDRLRPAAYDRLSRIL